MKRYTLLSAEERYLRKSVSDFLVSLIACKESVNNLAAHYMFSDYLINIIRSNFCVHYVLRTDKYYRTLGAQTEAAYLYNLDVHTELVFFYLFFKFLCNSE